MTAPEFPPHSPPQSLPKSQLQCPPRQESELRQRQEQGELRVRVAAEYRDLVREVGLAGAYAATDVVVAA
jgi:L-aspartate semialdehyde sulfurtransferase